MTWTATYQQYGVVECRYVIANVMVIVDMDCHISANYWHHVIASMMVMVDMDCHISAVWGVM